MFKKLLPGLLGLIQDKSGKLSSKRAVSVSILSLAAADMSANGITWLNVALAAVGTIPLLLTVFENKK